MGLKNLFLKQKQHLDYFFNQLNIEHCETVFNEIYASKGVLFFTGVGKSGYIAQKVAATIMSTGTKAFFLSPIDAIHGDLGMISKEDLILIFSKSGESDELLQLLPFIRSKQARACAVTSNASSRLAKGVNFFVELPCERELCPFDLAPTTSSEIQLLFGDVLAIALMKAKGFGLDEYAKNHPGGRIGRRAAMKVRDLMLDRHITPICFLGDRLEEVLLDFTNKRCGCLIVIDENKQLKGIFTDGDLRRALQAKGEQVLKEKMQNLMTSTPKAIEADTPAWEAMKLMESDQKHPVMVLPVLDKDEVIGIIKLHDLIQANL
ncbi:MAG: KpsF/GutQ family sugar-phosphate isomerase [Chlamydiales bacterium]